MMNLLWRYNLAIAFSIGNYPEEIETIIKISKRFERPPLHGSQSGNI
jgi:hypothetical protein